jgi:hypothetical protein
MSPHRSHVPGNPRHIPMSPMLQRYLVEALHTQPWAFYDPSWQPLCLDAGQHTGKLLSETCMAILPSSSLSDDPLPDLTEGSSSAEVNPRTQHGIRGSLPWSHQSLTDSEDNRASSQEAWTTDEEHGSWRSVWTSTGLCGNMDILYFNI